MDGLLSQDYLGNSKLFGSSGSSIKSIQRGETRMGTTPNNVPISAVNLAKAIAKISIKLPAGADSIANGIAVKARLTSSTNLELTMVDTTWQPYVEWEVIEFNNVKSLQTGLTSISTTSQTATIASVDTSKSIIFFSFTTTDVTTTNADYLLSGKITNATTIIFEQLNARTKSVSWFVIEFN